MGGLFPNIKLKPILSLQQLTNDDGGYKVLKILKKHLVLKGAEMIFVRQSQKLEKTLINFGIKQADMDEDENQCFILLNLMKIYRMDY